MRYGALLAALVVLSGCGRLDRRRAQGDAGGLVLDAAAPVVAAPSMRAIDPNKELPLGHWESEDGPKLCLTLLPNARARWASPVPFYHQPARVFGDIKHAEAISDDDFQITIDVTKIYAKEIGPCHRYWTDFALFEAAVLGERVTSPDVDGHKLPELDGGTKPEPPRTYVLHFDKTRDHVEVCTSARAPVCKKLVKRKSPSDFSRARTHAECKVDTDCVLVKDGEQCDPCLCPSVPSVRSWPKRVKPEDRDKDDSWERTPEHLCGAEVTRLETCAPCSQPAVACKNKVCVLKK